MKIGIMGAMLEEINNIHSHLENVSIVKHGGREYHIGKINHHEIILVFSRWGKVASAATATTLINKFDVEKIIFTGVAGAVSPDLNIGDIVISEQLYQHDMDARPLMPRYQVPLTNITFFKADPTLINYACSATKDLFNSLSEKLKPDMLKQFNIVAPKTVVGTIATGDQFIRSSEQSQEILKENPETAAVEMEGAAVAQICNDYNIPFVIIRTISDKADHTSEIDFPKFIEEIAGHYSEHIVENMICKM
jgi:adenosylhomocysteine nucleosidase